MAGKVFEVEIGGKVYEVEAPDHESALKAVQGFGQKPAAPQEQPIAQGDWQGLADRVQAAGERMPAGMTRESAMAEQGQRNRMDEAKRQGEMYGKAQGPGSTFGRSVAGSFAMGLPNLLEAYSPSWLGGQDVLPGKEAHEFIKAADSGRQAANPISGITGQIGGGVAQTMVLPAAKAISGGGTLPTAGRVLAGGATGAATGAAEGYITSRGDTDTAADKGKTGGLFGLAGATVGEALARGVSKVAGAFSKPKAPPSTEELANMASDAYKRAEQSGAMYSNQAASDLVNRLKTSFADFGFIPSQQPGAAAVLSEIERAVASGQPITLKGLEVLRRMAGNGYNPANKADNALLRKVTEEIDALAANQGATIGGKAGEGADALKEARDLWSRTRKAETVDEALMKAERRAASTGTGGNVDNASRQNIRSILDSPSKRRGFTPDELDAMETVARGTPGQNFLRMLGGLSPDKGAIPMMANLAAAGSTGMASIPVSMAAYGARKLADGATAKNAEALDALIRAGGNRSALQAPPNAVQQIANDPRIPILAALMMSNTSQAGSR